MKIITLDELLTQWWDTHLETKEELNRLDWDEILEAIGISIEDYEGKVPIVNDFDNLGKTVLISFSLG